MLFRYTFRRMIWWHEKVVPDFTPFISSIIILSAFQGFNVFFFISLVEFLCDINLLRYRIIIYLPPFIFLLINLLYFNSKDRQIEINNWFNGLSKRKRIKYDLFMILYFCISLLLLFGIGYKMRNS